MTDSNNHGGSNNDGTVEVECPWSDLFGKHSVKLFPPVLDQGLVLDPHCQHRCRVHEGPPPRLSKLED